jgi:hypothetical protein
MAVNVRYVGTTPYREVLEKKTKFFANRELNMGNPRRI